MSMPSTSTVPQPGEREGISFAHQNREDLPRANAPDGLSKTHIRSDFYMAANHIQPHSIDENHQSSVVNRDRPKPAPRPSPSWGRDPDRATHNRDWDHENLPERAKYRLRESEIAPRTYPVMASLEDRLAARAKSNAIEAIRKARQNNTRSNFHIYEQ